MKQYLTIEFSPTRLKQMKKIALSGSRAKLKILNGKITEGFQLLKTTTKKFQSFARDLADRIPQTQAVQISLDLFSHFERQSSKRLGIPKGIVLGGVLALMCSLPVAGQVFTNVPNEAALITAINIANADAVNDHVIRLEQGSPTTIYNLSAALPIITNTTKAISIICTGTTNAIIDGGGTLRPLKMALNTTLSLSKITIQNGRATKGGAIYNKRGNLTISDCLISTNVAFGAGTNGRGAGIYSTGTGGSASVLIQNSTISLNSASRIGAGIFNTEMSSLTILNSSITGNTSNLIAGGILNLTNSSLSISSSTISGNISTGSGGGIYSFNNSTLSISNSILSGNKSGNDGGGIFNRLNSTLTISSSSISGNTSANIGGGIYTQDSNIIIQASSLTTNQATAQGGAMAILAGGIGGKTSLIQNTTISANSSTANVGAGIFHSSPLVIGNSITLQHVTLSNNTGSGGIGTGDGFANAGSTADITLQNSIIANSIGTGNDFDIGGATINAASTSNIVESGLVHASVTVTDPMLNALTTGVQTLQVGSPAIDAASAGAATANDQLGLVRLAPHDMGAVQFAVACPILVSSTANLGAGTLRQAILDANASSSDCVIYLDQGTTYTITSNLPNISSTATGGKLAIICTGTSNAIIDGNNANRPLTMDIGSDLSISKITIQNGRVTNGNGGAIFNNRGNLTVSNSLISNNQVGGGIGNGRGGGIYSTGLGASTLIQGSTISFNSAINYGGGIYSKDNTLLTISNSFILGNTSNGNGAGIFNQNNSPLNISSSTISGNISGDNGGGIFNQINSSVNISNSIISSNQTTAQSGAGIFNQTNSPLTISSSSISGNISNAAGGGISNTNSLLTISSSFISGNTSVNFGAGIANNNGILTISSSSISGNISSAEGGGIFSTTSNINITASSLTTNQSTNQGGAILIFGGFGGGNTVLLQNTTISENTSTGNTGGGIYFTGRGQASNSITLQHVTLSNNSGNGGAGTGGFENGNLGGGNGSVTIQNTIIANSTGADFGNSGGGTLTLVTASIVEDGSMAGTTSGDPLLNALSGGVHTLQTGSIAVDAASTADALANDQLGILRTVPHDIGAIEFGDAPVPCPIDVTTNADSGLGSLRQAILDANASPTDCVIYLDQATTYTISSNLPNIANKATGGKLAIICTGTTNAVIDGNNANRPLTMSIGADLTISKLTLSSGSALKGGAIYNNRGTLTVFSSTITENRAVGTFPNGKGGGIYSKGTGGSALVLIQNSTISQNIASTRGGGVYNRNNSRLTISSTTIMENSANNGSGGGVWNNLAANLSISNSSISGNTSSNSGAGIFNRSSNNMTIVSSSISGNISGNFGGGVYSSGRLSITNSSFSENTSNNRGGGLFNAASNLSITSSSFSGNISSSSGGGLINYGYDMNIQACSFSSNQSLNQGGAIMTIKLGGSSGSSTLIQNTTISGNTSTGSAGGGIYYDNSGGIHTLTLQHVTLSDNTGNGGAATGDGFANTGTTNIIVQNSILANSIGAGDDFALGGGTLTLVTASISGDGTLVHANAMTANPMLNVLSGGVQTLQLGSPAINAASTTAVTANDQLGTPRTAPHDMGAVQSCTFNVTTNTDVVAVDGLLSLREAITYANANIDNCIIYLDEATIYTISSNLPAIADKATGGTLQIICTGTTNAIIDGAANRPLTMAIGSDLTISKITVQNGSALKGGGIYNNQGDLTVSNSILSNNTATSGSGGGIYSTGNGSSASVLVQNSIISFNSVSNRGAGIYNITNSLLTISSSTISGNTAFRGAGIFNKSSDGMSISSSSISGNTSTDKDGGIYSTFSANLSISASLISNNTGGGISNVNSNGLRISGSSISGNTKTGSGAGISNINSDNLSISSSSISGNIASIKGGGIYNNNSDMLIQASSITLNSATTNKGGGIYTRSTGTDAVTIINTTISSNEASAAVAGGIYTRSTGLLNTLTLQHVTLSNNSGTVTGGFANDGLSTLDITLQNTIIGNNINTDFALGGASINAASTSNIVETGLVHGSATALNPLLGALTLNSGFLVHPLQTGSPAIDAASTSVATANDQLGVLRVAPHDMGAVQFGAVACMVVSAPTGATNTWIGCTNSDWQTATNWSSGSVPTASDVVYVPIVAANPLIIDEVATCHKLIVQIGAKCTINYNAGGKLLIKF